MMLGNIFYEAARYFSTNNLCDYIYRFKPMGRGAQCVLHGPTKLQPHGEEVLIVQDPDGHEICFVDARGFQKCTDVGKSAVS